MDPQMKRAGALSAGDLRLLVAAGVLSAASGATRFTASGSVLPFVVSGLALAALAALVGRCVDRLGSRLGAGATGVVQSALGNLPELFFGIFALRAGLVTVVQSALIGSILANVLLLLGVAFIAGGLRNGVQRFAADPARNLVLLLALAVAVLIIPTATSHLQVPAAMHEGALSDIAAVILLVVFALSVPSSLERRGEPSPATGGSAASTGGWPLSLAIGLLAASSGAAALVADWFVHALTPAISTLGISQTFAGLVIVAIAGNAVEHVVGVQLSFRNRADYAVSVIMQSPVQIALALIPALVLLSNVLGGPQLTLVLPLVLVVVLAITTVVVVIVIFDGKSNWLEGVTLVGLYGVIAASFWWG
jgi:Ca2+:H+ antiporter